MCGALDLCWKNIVILIFWISHLFFSVSLLLLLSLLWTYVNVVLMPFLLSYNGYIFWNLPCHSFNFSPLCRHLIGFFLFLSLTIYTAMKVPNVVDLNLPSALRNADFQKLHAELITCLPSLPHMPDLQRLREELKTALPSMNLSPYLSNWHIVELLSNCLPENLTHSNHTDTCVLVLYFLCIVVFLVCLLVYLILDHHT